MADEYPTYCDPSYVMPANLDVVVPGSEESVRVTVDKASKPKPYLGGYRHKKTGLVYHHASSQSDELGLIPPRRSVENLRNRDTQTYDTRTRSTQSYREYGTQMVRTDLHMDNAADREMPSKRYFTAAQLLDLKKQKTLNIQCFWRRYVARCRSQGIRRRLHERRLAQEEAAEQKAQQEAKLQQYEVERRVNPRTRQDFELLYNELDTWRTTEVERVEQMTGVTACERKETMNAILDKETKALQRIDRLKAQAAKDGRARHIECVMDLMAQPKRWEVGNGELQEVHTPFTTRAAELRDLYHGLTQPASLMDDRLQMLLNVKWTVRVRSSSFTASRRSKSSRVS